MAKPYLQGLTLALCVNVHLGQYTVNDHPALYCIVHNLRLYLGSAVLSVKTSVTMKDTPWRKGLLYHYPKDHVRSAFVGRGESSVLGLNAQKSTVIIPYMSNAAPLVMVSLNRFGHLLRQSFLFMMISAVCVQSFNSIWDLL